MLDLVDRGKICVEIMIKSKKKNKLSAKVIKASRDRAGETMAALEKVYPDAHCALDHSNALELLIATILSAQCTDKRVNMVTPALFARYKNAEDFAAAKLSDLETMIRSTGFYKNKSKNIQKCCQRIVEEFDGKVPDTMEDLLSLAGVARKTANVVLWNAFGKNEGVVVDTHVGRIAVRLGWTAAEAPAKVEADLMKLLPRKKWGEISHLLIYLGRDVCKAPTPLCGSCKITKLCPWFKEIISKEKNGVKSKAAPKTHNI